MPLVFKGQMVSFEDVCTVEDALPLLEFLKVGEAAEIDLSACTYLHTALLQLLADGAAPAGGTSRRSRSCTLDRFIAR